MKAIVIENEVLKIMLIREYLENNVATITVAKTMKEALPLLESERFEYLFLDHHLPDCKGSELLSVIKGKHNEMKCVSISNDYIVENSYKEMGYDDIFNYPFDKSVERIFK